jgi:hypothetical protein
MYLTTGTVVVRVKLFCRRSVLRPQKEVIWIDTVIRKIRSQFPYNCVHTLIFLVYLMMTYQSETRWINTGINNCCVWLDLLWFLLSITQWEWALFRYRVLFFKNTLSVVAECFHAEGQTDRVVLVGIPQSWELVWKRKKQRLLHQTKTFPAATAKFCWFITNKL